MTRDVTVELKAAAPARHGRRLGRSGRARHERRAGLLALADRAPAAGRRRPTARCARSATRCTRRSSRCIATWRASTSRSRRWIASWSTQLADDGLHRATRTTSCWSADRARARRIWPRPSACRASPGTASGCASTRRSIWSTRWSRRRRRARPGASPLSLLRMDLVILDELGYLPFSQAGGALLFHLLSQALRAHQRDDHDQPGLRRVVQRVRRREDDHRAARPAHAPLPHRGDGQRVASASATARAEAKKRIKAREQARKGAKHEPPAGRHLMHAPRGESRYGLRPARLPPRDQPQHRGGQRNSATTYTYPQPTISKSASTPGSILDRHGGSDLNRRRHAGPRADPRVPVLRPGAPCTAQTVGWHSSLLTNEVKKRA